ncbi:MAG: response regulator [Elusimicrobia bacterium]|nr:response regulator [Elusimicrobiota bacterium]
MSLFGFGRKRPVVLHVDDSPFIILTVKVMLEQLGCEPLGASSGADGVKLAAKEKPDVILLDAMMPVMDGYQTAELLRTSPETKDIPIIMLTGADTVKDVDKATQWASAYLVKPVKIDRLKAKLGSIIKLPES